MINLSNPNPDPQAQLAAVEEFNARLAGLNERFAALHVEIVELMKTCPHGGDFVAQVLADCGVSQGEFLMTPEAIRPAANPANN